MVTASTLVEGKDYRMEFEVAVNKFGVHNHLKSESLLAHNNRYKEFCKFAKKVEEINSNKDATYLAVNNFMSILTEVERNSYLGLNITGHEVSGDFLMAFQEDNTADIELQVASSRDYSKKISDVKDQGGCGSCWTYAATAALEGEIYFTTGETKVSLSEQEYMECSTRRDGCQGGWMEDCYAYSIKNDRIAPTSAYRYTGKDSMQCQASGKANALTETNTRLTRNVEIKGDSQLLKFADKHIVSVAIEVVNSFHGYAGGVYNEKNCNNQANHAVAVVGYGKQGNSKFWKIRNSWGKGWGDKGYILMSRDINNQCLISTYSHIPEVECRGNSCQAPDDGDDSDDGGDDDGGDDTDSDCIDQYDDCPTWARYDFCTVGEYIDFMEAYCEKSCELCGDGDDGDDTDSDCVDQYEECPTWESYDYCTEGEYIDFMENYCEKSCELCGEDEDDGDDDDSNCFDKEDKESCIYWADQGYCTYAEYEDYMKENCAKSCKECGGDDGDDGDDGGDDDDDDETNFCRKKVYLGKCVNETAARETCEKEGLKDIECVVIRVKRCWYASSGTDSGSNYVETLQEC